MSEKIQKISASDFVVTLQANERPLIVDVRTAAEVNSLSLDGCVNIPLHELSSTSLQNSCSNNREQDPVYLLCGTGQRAQRAAEHLVNDVANPLIVIEGGINAIKQTDIVLNEGASKMIPLERQVRIASGSLVLLGVVLGAVVSPLFYGLSAFVGAGLVFAGVTDSCAMGMLLAKMPWNRAS